MRFWDASAVVPLIHPEPSTGIVRDLLVEDGELLVWWGTVVECASAVARREREGILGARTVALALAGLDALREGWSVVLPTDRMKSLARRLLRCHPLRSADALQLAAAIQACETEPGSLPFVSLDERLSAAARREGFGVLPEEPPGPRLRP